MLFCPVCANLLLVRKAETEHGEQQQFWCQTCPYVSDINRTVTHKLTLPRKRVDDVLGGAQAWENVDQTDAVCPTCEHKSAFYFQVQIRSADEPSTTFYKCASNKCGARWRDG